MLAAQVAPVAHLARHDDDHTHGPDRSSPPHSDPSADHDHGKEHDHAPESSDIPANDHGQASAAHFGLALLQGPPAPFLPRPATTLAPPPAALRQGRRAGARRQPPSRGPPSQLL